MIYIKDIEKKKLWVYEYLEKNKVCDILNEAFVDEYIRVFNPKNVIVMPYGANKCKELNTLLDTMYKEHYLSRSIIGISGLGAGFPKWVYVYEL